MFDFHNLTFLHWIIFQCQFSMVPLLGSDATKHAWKTSSSNVEKASLYISNEISDENHQISMISLI